MALSDKQNGKTKNGILNPDSYKRLFIRKSVDQILSEADSSKHKLKRSLTAIDVTAIGIGSIIGAGIFVLVGVAYAKNAGPAIVLSFVIAGLACVFVAFCYAELASMIPIAGSAYTFSYASMGEFIAWLIGWDLILEYSMGGIAVSTGWSGYIVELFASVGIDLPVSMTNGPFVEGGIFNLPAVFIVLAITLLLVLGSKESARVNLMIVIIKVFVLIFIILLGMRYYNGGNFTPFLPYGRWGIVTGAGVIFFAFIGFEAVCTTAEEVKDPGRNLPRGILMSLVVCTVLYILAALILVGLIPFDAFLADEKTLTAPFAYAFTYNDVNWAASIISMGAIAGITSVLLVSLLAQPRVLFVMSRDGLIPPGIAKVHPKYGTPYIATIVTGSIVAVCAGIMPIDVTAKLVNIGTLFAFTLVCFAIPILRITDPHTKRPFKAPFSPIFPMLGAGFAIMLMISLPPLTWLRFALWMGIGIVIYANYGYFKSKTYTRLKEKQ